MQDTTTCPGEIAGSLHAPIETVKIKRCQSQIFDSKSIKAASAGDESESEEAVFSFQIFLESFLFCHTRSLLKGHMMS